MKPARSLVTDPGGLPRPAIAGDGPRMDMVHTIIATVGNGALLGNLLTSGLILRNGPTVAYTDTIDTGVNLDLAFPNLGIGDSVDFFFINNVAFAATIAFGAGVTALTAAANNVIAASTGRLIHLEKIGVATYNAYVI